MNEVGERWRVRCEFFPFYLHLSYASWQTHSITSTLALPLDWVPFYSLVNKMCTVTNNLFNTQFQSNDGEWEGEWKHTHTPVTYSLLNTASGRFSSSSSLYQVFMKFLLVSVTNSKQISYFVHLQFNITFDADTPNMHSLRLYDNSISIIFFLFRNFFMCSQYKLQMRYYVMCVLFPLCS